jgi:hypothetical protein
MSDANAQVNTIGAKEKKGFKPKVRIVPHDKPILLTIDRFRSLMFLVRRQALRMVETSQRKMKTVWM